MERALTAFSITLLQKRIFTKSVKTEIKLHNIVSLLMVVRILSVPVFLLKKKEKYPLRTNVVFNAGHKRCSPRIR